jgi:ribosomal protein L16/L10AE
LEDRLCVGRGEVDPIAAVVKSSVELFEYLRCDAAISDAALKAMMPIICGQMRP